MKQQTKGGALHRLWQALPWLWMAAAYLFDLWYQLVPGKWIVDSDLASEMILSDLLNKEGSIISHNWFYSTELKVVNLQWFYRLGLLLFPEVKGARVLVGTVSNSGTTRYFTELDMRMTWHEVEGGEERAFDWYAQGVDLAGEKGVGKAQTYAEKYFLLKFFHVPTKKDDPDEARRTSRGELRQAGTQAAAETAAYQRQAVEQMALELCGGDLEKVRQTYVVMTRNEARGYAGTDDLGKLSRAALAIVYGRMKATYKDRLGKEFVFKAEVADDVVEG